MYVNVFLRHCIIVSECIYFSDRPQMVHLHKIPSEFGIARMRDSFLRQFIEQGTETELFMNSVKDSQEDLWTMSKECSVPLLSRSKHKSATGTPQKKSGVGSIIRYDSMSYVYIYTNMNAFIMVL